MKPNIPRIRAVSVDGWKDRQHTEVQVSTLRNILTLAEKGQAMEEPDHSALKKRVEDLCVLSLTWHYRAATAMAEIGEDLVPKVTVAVTPGSIFRRLDFDSLVLESRLTRILYAAFERRFIVTVELAGG